MFRILAPASIIAAVVFTFMQPAIASATGCVDTIGRHAILAADAVDPDVFVWNRRASLLDYSSGVWMSTGSVLEHTLLEKPGTRAIVISCIPSEVKSRFSGSIQDAVGIRILSGQHIGRYGWAVEEDVHTLITSIGSK